MNPTNRFPNTHRYDRNYFLTMLLLTWAAIVSGFTYDIIKLKTEGRLHFPWITHIHAALFIGWLVFFSTQILLIRNNNHKLHRKLGVAGAVLAALMVIAGCATAIISEGIKFGTPFADTAFMSVMFGDMLVFAVLISAGIYLRKNPAAHKRLILVATLTFTDAGFGRWLSSYIEPLFGNNYWTYHSFAEGFWPFFGFQMLPSFILILSVGVYDLITRKRLHPAYVWAVLWWLVVNIAEGYLYFSPQWMRIAKGLIGH